PLIAAFGSLALGSLVLLAWAFDVAVIKGLPGLATIQASAATSFMLGGLSLLMLIRGADSYLWSRLFAAGLLGLMGLTWVGILLAETGATSFELARLEFRAVLGFRLEGIALLLLTSDRRNARAFGGQAALCVAFVGWVGLIVSTYSVGLTSWGSVSRMALTALGM